jgi:zinc transport system ATP-binding protein
MLLILDEPVTGVDVESQTRFYSVIKRISEENGITMVWSSHDLDAINKYASRVACMNRKLFFHGDKDQFFADEDLLKTYTESTMQMHMHDHRV